MQAIILAAGMGKRLGELTNNNTKCMIKVNGVTLIERALRQLEKYRLKRIIIVIGYEGIKLKKYISTLKTKTEIVYVENPIYYKTNNIYSLYLAKKYLLEDDTLLMESDLIFEETVVKKILNHPYPNLALVAKFESWMDGTVVTVDDNDNIVRFITTDKFSFEEIPSYYKTVNIYKFSQGFSSTHYVPFLEAYSKALGNNEYYEQVLKVITMLDKPELKALRLGNESWYEIDDIQDLDIAESVFAEKEEKLAKIQSRYGGYWRYPALLDFCYLVNPYFPNEKLMSEIKANFDRLIVEYPSGMRVNSLLVSKNFKVKEDYICVGNGAAELIKALTEYFKGKIGIAIPTFEEYINRKNTLEVVTFQAVNTNLTYNSNDLINYFSDKDIASLILINPDNPSGNFVPYSELLNICDWAEKLNINLIIDESFVDFTDDFENNSLLNDRILERYPNLVVVKSISKSYGVAGLRLGIIASSNIDFISFIKKDVAIWNINSFAEFYLQIFGKYENEYKKGCIRIIEERKRFYEKLINVPYLRVIPSQANYFLCEVKYPFTAKSLTEKLLCESNILIKNCTDKLGFNGKQYVRIAVRNSSDNEYLVSKLMKIAKFAELINETN